MESSPLANLYTSLASLNQTQQEALLQLCNDQEQQIKQGLRQQAGFPAPLHPHQDGTAG